MARGQTVKGIEQAIARLEAERAAYNLRIDGRIEGLREALAIQGGVPIAPQQTIRKRIRRGNLEETVIDILTIVADKGLTAEECVATAKTEKGITLVQGSVSSLLSRLKADDVVFFDGQRYRLKQYAGPRHAA